MGLKQTYGNLNLKKKRYFHLKLRAKCLSHATRMELTKLNWVHMNVVLSSTMNTNGGTEN